MQVSWSYHCRMRSKIFKTICRSWSPITPFWNRKLIRCVQVLKSKNPEPSHFLFTNWYRPPNSPIELFDKFEVLLAKIEAENVESNILGDINCDMMAVTPANETRHLIELCELFQYTQLIKEPTRVTLSTKSLIDLFLTNEPVKFATSGVSPIGCSDRSLIYVSRKLTCPRSIPWIIESRQYKNFVPDDFVNVLTWRWFRGTQLSRLIALLAHGRGGNNHF